MNGIFFTNSPKNFVRALICFLSFVMVTQDSLATGKKIAIAEPPIPLWATGIYQKDITGLHELLGKGKLIDFYIKADGLIRNLNEKRSVLPDAWTSDEVFATEWFIYLLIMAPFLPDEEFLKIEKDMPKNIWEAPGLYVRLMNHPMTAAELTELAHKNPARKRWSDTSIKHEATARIINTPVDVETMVTHLTQAHMQARQKLPPKAALQKVAHDTIINRFYYHVALTRFYAEMRKISLDEQQNLKPKYTPGFERKKTKPAEIPPGMSIDVMVPILEKSIEEARKNEDPAEDYYRRKGVRIIDKRMSSGPESHSYQSNFIYRLVCFFPEEPSKIHEFLKMAGYETDAECAKVIATIFPKTKETAYLYEGLKLEDVK